MSLRRASPVLHVCNVARYRAQVRHGLIPEDSKTHLVRLLDEVFALLEAEPNLRHFTLDGEVSLIETYLKVRPERRELVKQLIGDGRLLIGPWYVAPEPALTNVESLIRNLLIGATTANFYGQPMLVGYLPEAGGLHTALPQILKGFGIQSVITYAGLSDQPLELLYRGLDGSQVVIGNLRDDVFAEGDTLATLRSKLASHSESGHLLILSQWQQGTTAQSLRAWLQRLNEAPEQIKESNPVAYSKTLGISVLNDELPTLSNPFELTASGRAVRDWNVGITRGVLRWLEPFYCWRENANLGHSRLRHPESLIDQLWKQILADQADTALHEPQNQARREERERYYQHRVDELCDVSLHALTENVDTAALPVQGMTALLVFNSGSARVRGTFRFQIGWARSEPEQDKLYALYVYDQEGKLVGGAIPTEQTEFVQELLFSVDVPAFGYSSYSVALEPIHAEFRLPVESKRGDLRGYVTAFHKGSLPVSTAMLTVSDWRFEITAIKLPEDGRRGVIVRGSNRDEQPLTPTIKLWRPFKFCEAVRMDEALTAAKMNMDAEGAFKFKATPHRILTFWLHD